MKNRKRPRMKNQERDLYQTPSDCSEEEIERSCEFLRKVNELDDEKIFVKFVYAMKSYQSKSLSYIDLKTKVDSILRDYDALVYEFHRLLSDLATDETAKSDVERTVLKRPKRGFEDVAEECRYVTPSYMIRLDAEEESSSSKEILNDKYVSTGHYDPDKLKKRRHSLHEVKMNNLEDKLLKEDMYLKALDLVVKFGNEIGLSEKPPLGFNEVVKKFYKDMGKNVPREFKTDPKRAIQGILPILKSTKKEMTDAKELKVRKIYDRQRRKQNVNN